MKKDNTNRAYKDGLFQLLFNDKERLLELFNALEGTDYKDPEVISIETLETALYNRMINDLAFAVENFYIILAEHQSTENENMPIRMFLYLAREYERMLDLDMLHKKKRYEIPTPHFYVLYNGPKKLPPVTELKLSDAYRKREDHPMLQMIVKVVNINAEDENPIFKKCPTLYGYSRFVQVVRQGVSRGLERDDAIEAAINTCIDQGVLSDFLKIHGAEVTNAMFKEYTLEDIVRIRSEEAAEEAAEEALELGIKAVIDTCRELAATRQDTKLRIISKFSLKEEDAERYMDRYWME